VPIITSLLLLSFLKLCVVVTGVTTEVSPRSSNEIYRTHVGTFTVI